MIDFQLCAKGREFPSTDKWLIEPKLNGVRFGVQFTRRGPMGFGRRVGLSIPKHILDVLPELETDSFLDGEFIFGEDERSANSVVARDRPPLVGTFYVFDYVLGPLDKATLLERKERLDALELGGPILDVPWKRWESPELTKNLFDFFADQKLMYPVDGMVMKRIDKKYTPGRHVTWLKFKP